MDAQRWAVIKSVYHAALEKERGERLSYLAAACAEDPTLRSEVESLLGYADFQLPRLAELSTVAELEEKIGGDGPELLGAAAAASTAALPTTIGRYRILRLLAEGGMGVVYEAEQEQPRRTVALKVIKPGLAGAELLRRFEQESQTLGRLQHPGIAQIYEAGTADTGFGPQPYFAMEFIHGESLLEYVKAHEFNTRQRLELMVKVCEAVHHAHQRGIIHRDLKPSNILVDESSQPKVLDFGVAHVTDSDAQATRQTDVGRLVGTLAYMSPEQVLADPLELDTRSDVYALGVIVYELLAGRLPYSVSRNLPEAVQAIREEDPARLSSISRTYRGDIETIVAKALEKDKARRYGSAAGLADDIRRYLADDPIVARPPSTTYQLQKFARRHKPMVAGVAAVFMVLIAGIVVSTWEAARARSAERTALRERDRAAAAEGAATAERNRALAAEKQALQERNRTVIEKQRADTESATARAVNDFLQNDLLAQASTWTQTTPDTPPDPDLRVRTALDRAATRIEGKFAEQPLVEASIRLTIGKAYLDLALYSNAQQHVERALALRQRVLGRKNADTLTTMNELAGLYTKQGLYAQAERLFSDVLDLRRQLLGQGHPDTLESMNDMALLYENEGKFVDAELLLTKALAVHRRLRGEEHPDTLIIMTNLAEVYLGRGKYVQAEPLLLRSVEVQRRVLGEEHPNTLISMTDLARVYLSEGKYAQAESLLTRTIEVRRRVLGQEHPATLGSMAALAWVYLSQGEYLQAEPLLIKTLEVRRHVLGDEHPQTLGNMHALALLYFRQRKYTQAEPLFTEALEAQRRVLGEKHPDTLLTMNTLAGVYFFARQYEKSEVLLREALNTFEKSPNPDRYLRFNCQSLLGASLAGQKRYAEAEPLLIAGYEGMLQREASIPAGDRFLLERNGEWIVQLYQDWGKPDKATEWREKLRMTTSAAHAQ